MMSRQKKRVQEKGCQKISALFFTKAKKARTEIKKNIREKKGSKKSPKTALQKKGGVGTIIKGSQEGKKIF